MYTNPLELAIGDSLFNIRDAHSRTNDESRTTNHEYPNWYMEMQTLGYNYRLTDFQAALGHSQLQRADEGLQRRKEIATTYYNAFKNIPQITDRNKEANRDSQFAVRDARKTKNEPRKTNHKKRTTNHENGHAYHLYVIEAENRLDLYNYLREHKIFTQIHYIPMHLMPYYQQFGWKPGDMPHAEAYYSKCISLPMFPTLTDENQAFVISKIKEFYINIRS